MNKVLVTALVLGLSIQASATQGGKRMTLHYVSPSATGSGNGTISNPWTIQQLMVHPAALLAGDTAYLRQGVYRFALDQPPEAIAVRFNINGTAANPITVRSYPGELATIAFEWILEFEGSYTNYRDLEITTIWNDKTFSYGGALGVTHMRQKGLDVNVINCYIHDVSAIEQTFKIVGQSGEFYGNVAQYVGNIGFAENRTMGTTGYAHSVPGPLLVKHNILIDQLGHNLQHFGSTDEVTIQNTTVEENMIAQAGTQAILPNDPDRSEGINVFLNTPDEAPPVTNYKFNKNYVYSTLDGSTSIFMPGRAAGGNNGLEFMDNVIVGGGPPFSLGEWSNITGSGNTIVDSEGVSTIINDVGIGESNLATSTFNNNTYHSASTTPFHIYPVGSGSQQFLTLAQWRTRSGWDANSTLITSMPTSVRYDVYANEYEQGRANIYIYNPGLLDNVNVSLANSGLVNGQTYKIQDAQKFLGPAVFFGTYSSSSPTITLNLGAMTARAFMLGEDVDPTYMIPNHTTKELAALVVLPISAGAIPPTVSLTAPTNGSTVSGTVSVTATAGATSPATVISVKYYLDGILLGTGGASPTYSYSWNTLLSANGARQLKAIVTDSNGLTRESSTFTITVNNTGPDTAPPTVSISNLVTGDFITYEVTLKATATDNVAVASVQFRYRLNGAGSYNNIGSPVTTAPYEIAAWDVTAFTAGSYEITALATDTATPTPNTTVSAAVTVTLVTTVGYTSVVNAQFGTTDGTNVNSYVSDSGHTWSRHNHANYATGNLLIDDGRVHAGNDTNRALSLNSYVPPTGDYRVRIPLRTVLADESQIGIVGHADPTTDQMIFLNWDGQLKEIALWHRDNGPNTKLGSYPVGFGFNTTGSEHQMMLEFTGTLIHVYIEGIRRISNITNPITTSQRRSGIRGPGTAQTATTGFHVGSFRIFVVASTVPAAPTNLTCVPISNTEISCTFIDNADNETGFIREKSTNGTDWVSAGADLAANVTSFTVTTATGAQFYYRVRAKTATEESANSTTGLVTTTCIHRWKLGQYP